MEIWRNLTDTIARYGNLPYIYARITKKSTKPEMFLMFQNHSVCIHKSNIHRHIHIREQPFSDRKNILWLPD